MRVLTVVCLLALAAIACNLGVAPTPQPRPTLNATSIAQTLMPVPNGTSATADAAATGSIGASGSTTFGDGGGTLTSNCTPRSDWPTMTITQGDTLSGIALRTYTTVDALVLANCLPSSDAITAGQPIRVPVQPVEPTVGSLSSGASNAAIPANCAAAWFFNFTRTAADNNCPNPAITVEAVGQNFQGGRVYRYAAAPTSGQPSTIYVIFNDGTWQTFNDTWDASQPNDDPSIVPDAGWYKPFGAIGKLWRENPQLRQALGWAYQPESAFSGRIQAPVNSTGYFYIDHGLRNLVLRLNSGSTTPNQWQVVGSY
jgi:LysM repeat protein